MYKKGDYVVREVGGQCHHDGDGYGGLVDEDGTVHKWKKDDNNPCFGHIWHDHDNNNDGDDDITSLNYDDDDSSLVFCQTGGLGG